MTSPADSHAILSKLGESVVHGPIGPVVGEVRLFAPAITPSSSWIDLTAAKTLKLKLYPWLNAHRPSFTVAADGDGDEAMTFPAIAATAEGLKTFMYIGPKAAV